MSENQDPDQDPAPLDRAVELLTEVDLQLRDTTASDSTPKSPSDLLSEIDTHMRVPLNEQLRLDDLETLRETLEKVESLVDEHEQQTNVADTVRGVVRRFRGTTPDPGDAARAAIAFYERIVDIRETSLEMRQQVEIGYRLVEVELNPADIDQDVLEEWHENADTVDRYLNETRSALDTYEQLERDHDETADTLEQLGVDHQDSLEWYFDGDITDLRGFELVLEFVSMLFSGVEALMEGYHAFEREEWTAAHERFELAHQTFTEAYQTYREFDEDRAHPFEVIPDAEVPTDEEEAQLIEGASAALDTIAELVEAGETAAAGNTAQAEQLYVEATETLENPTNFTQ